MLGTVVRSLSTQFRRNTLIPLSASLSSSSSLAMNGSSSIKMRSQLLEGEPLDEVVRVLQLYADTEKLAESWDNVGLLLEPSDKTRVHHILLTNDLTEDVMQEAIELETNMIVTYHPLIFSPVKSITKANWKSRIITKCIENRIAVYSPHTAMDACDNGVNNWLISAFDDLIAKDKDNDVLPIVKINNLNIGSGRKCQLREPIDLDAAVERVKKLTGLKHVRLARAPRTSNHVRKIGVCAGSGASVLEKLTDADLVVTGELSHHAVLDMVHCGTHVILTNHSESERGFLAQILRPWLERNLHDNVEVVCSKMDADPLITV